MKKYKLLVMSFDGDSKVEKSEFETVEEVWGYSNDLGSKWFFYPFHFVISASGKTIIDSVPPLDRFNGLRVKTVQEIFEITSKRPDTQGLNCDDYAYRI
jgi:hypothetical protein